MSDLDRRSAPCAKDESSRGETLRDRDRVLYSEAFRRLGGVTQVAIGSPNLTLHNRLTHSLKVEQVGYSLVLRLRALQSDEARELDIDAVRAACLAHDLGHPPFGHSGEIELNSLVTCATHRNNPRDFEHRQTDPCPNCKLEDGFEGNAQSFRIVASLAGTADVEAPGLNLTRKSVRALSKYPWLRDGNAPQPRKWGAYDCDVDTLRWASEPSEPSYELALEAQIMDWADDISYAVHDIEDFFRAGLVPLDDYKQNKELLNAFLDYCRDSGLPVDGSLQEAVEDALALGPSSAYAGTTADIYALQQLRRTLITLFINAASIENGRLVVDQTVRDVNAVIKKMTWYHIIDEPTLSHIQDGQRRVLREIFGYLHRMVEEIYHPGTGGAPDSRELRRLSPSLRRAIEICQREVPHSHYSLNQCLTRATLDHIASLSDEDAYRLHSILRGRESHGRIMAR